MISNDAIELTFTRIMDCCFEVHRTLGPGLFESVYSQCLVYELKNAGLKVEAEKSIPVVYKGTVMDNAFRLDLLVEDSIIVELKSIERISELHYAQVLNYMKFSKVGLGMLVNFNTRLLKNGIKRVVL